MSLNYGLGKTNCLTYIPNDIKLELNPLNVTVAGTPSFNNGVMSNISASNYAMLPKSFNPGSNNWEFMVKIQTSSSSVNQQFVGGVKGNIDGLEIGVNADSKFRYWLSTNNSSYDISNGTVGNHIVQPNTVYWVKVSFDGSKYVLSYSLNGSDFIDDIIVTNSSPIYGSEKGFGGDISTKGALWTGSIDIANSYIKINDQMWWQGGLGQIRLKKGSIVYVPDGILDGKKQFKKIILEEDTPYQNTGGSGNGLFVNYSPSDNRLRITSKVSTASENPNQDYSIWYDLTNNYLHRYGYDQDASVDYICSLPIGVVSQVGGAITSIDQVFNGVGYIGNTIFALPGVKGLIPNGWNEDGTYKNIYHTVPNVIIGSISNYNTTGMTFGVGYTDSFGYVDKYIESDTQPTSNYTWWVNIKENKLYYKSTSDFNYTQYYKIGSFDRTSGTEIPSISNFKVDAIQTTNESANIESIEYGVGKTNCLTELPNDIKYTLSASTLKVTGTPSVTTSGVASNLSGTSYFTTNKTFSPGSNTWEIGCKFKYVTADDNQIIFDINDGTTNYRPITCYAHNDDYIRYGLSSNITAYFNGGETKGKTLLVNGTTYWVKAIFDGSKYTFNLSTDGNTWIEDYSYTSSEKVYSGLPMQIGWWKGGTAYNRGSIYLNDYYFKYNDVEQWRGRLGSITIKKGSKLYYPNGFNTDGSKRFDEIILENDTNTYIECITNVCPLYLNISSNNIFRRGVGNIADVEANKLTNGAFYATDTNKFYNIGINSDNSTYEYLMPLPIGMITTNYNGVTSAHIYNGIGYINNIYFITPGVKYLEPNGWNEDGTYRTIARKTDKVKISWMVESSGTVTNRAMCITNGVAEADWMTLYEEVQSKEDATANWIYIKDENNIYPKSSLTVRAPRTKIGTMQVTDGKITNFKVDAIPTKNDTYPIKEIHQCVGKTNCLTYIPNDIKIDFKPLNVTVVGSPTINRGVASNFNDSNYLTIPKTFNPGSNNWEIVLKITTSDFSIAQDIGGYRDYKLSFYISTAGLATLNVGSGSAWTVTPNFGTLKANTTYWLKAEYKNGVYNAYTSTDGSTFTLGESETSTQIVPSGNINLGDYAPSGTNWFKGSIDLPNCYIKINDQMWWQGGIGQVTLKKGSKVYKPDGSYQITETDMTSWMTDVGNRFYYVKDDDGLFTPYALSTTGTAPTTTSGNEVVFNTSNNHIEYYANGTYVCDCSLPVCFGNNNKNIQVFNGIGFMGSTLFALPGIKGLIPNGWNEDGTYKNKSYENKDVLICNGWVTESIDRFLYIGSYPYYDNNTLWTNIKTYTYVQDTEPTAQEGNVYWFDTKNNIIKYTNNKGQSWTKTSLIAKFGDVLSASGKVSTLSVNPIPTKNDTRIIYKK